MESANNNISQPTPNVLPGKIQGEWHGFVPTFWEQITVTSENDGTLSSYEQLPSDIQSSEVKSGRRSRNRRKKRKNQSKVEINSNELVSEPCNSNLNNQKHPYSTKPVPLMNKSEPGNDQINRLGYEPNVFIVSGMKNTTPIDALSRFIKGITGEDAERITLLEEGRALVYHDNNLGIVRNINARSIRF